MVVSGVFFLVWAEPFIHLVLPYLHQHVLEENSPLIIAFLSLVPVLLQPYSDFIIYMSNISLMQYYPTGLLQCGWLGSPKFMHYCHLRVLGFGLPFSTATQNFSVLDLYLDPVPHDGALTICAGACTRAAVYPGFQTLTVSCHGSLLGPKLLSGSVLCICLLKFPLHFLLKSFCSTC